MAIKTIDDTILQGIAEEIQAKDGGGKMLDTEMRGRIAALPTDLIPKTITQNGTYNAQSDNVDGYDIVMVSVPEKNTLDECFANTLEVANIPSAISIVSYLFYNGTNLIDVIMPNVTSIGEYSFRNCVNLALTSLPSGVTTIDSNAFNGCVNLALTSLPSGLKNIGQRVFENCQKLALTSLPSGLKNIANYSFRGCRDLALTSLPTGVTYIGKSAFVRCTSIPYLDFSDFTQIPNLDVQAFDDTTFPFYFKDQQQLDEWAAATNWSTYADRFQIKPSGVI